MLFQIKLIKMGKFKLCLGLLLMFIVAGLKAQDSQFSEISDWKNLLGQAKKEKKMIFIDAYFVGCHPCKQMEEEVFILPHVRQQMKDNFVSVKIDFLKEELGKQLQIKYAVTGFPTYLLLNSDGYLVAMSAGYQEADRFQNLLADAVTKSKKGTILGGFSPVIDVAQPDFYRAYFSTEHKAITKEKLVPYLKGKDLFAETNAIPFLMGRSLNDELSSYLLKNYKKFETLYGRTLVWKRVMETLGGRLGKEIQGGRNDAKFESFLADTKPMFAKEDWPYARLDLAESYYMTQLKDLKAFFNFAVQYYNDEDNKIRYMGSRIALPGTKLEDKQLFASWIKKVVNENSGYEVLIVAARTMKELNDMVKARQYADWGVKKAKLINRSSKYFESLLN